MREAHVLGVHDPRAGKSRLDERTRAVGRLVVDDDHVELGIAGVFEDGAQARLQPVRLVGRDDDDREVVPRGSGHGVLRARPRAASSLAASSTRSTASWS